LPAFAQTKYRVAWSHYTGWEPWGYAQQAGILQKWGKKYGIDIELTLVNDYVESINLYTAGKFDACAMTNMDALSIPAVGGIDSTALVIGDFSNGNDGIVIKNGASVKDLKGRSVKLVELTVSHYMLARALEMNGMSERDIKVVNTSDADIAAVFAADANGAAVTWNPPLQQARNAKGATLVFDSSKIPGEIIDMMVVRTNAPDTLKKALAGAWYEVMGIMTANDKANADALAWMAKSSGATVPEFKAQLATTAMFYKAGDAVNFTTGEQLKKTMDYVRTFSFSKGLFGQRARSKDFVGIAFPDGSVIGDKKNVKLRFTADFMKMAAEGKL
ncbi:MAG TPA: putative urea ABC transporter substrate-binding protein, partial [Burkholderiaceae bacterium]|nr:putative urea ABC transporter substrate-binding protein [Burkholderiaceae bacterium]